MKTLTKIMALFVLMLSFATCSSDNEEILGTTMEINYANLNGTWKLVEWNGNSISDDAYCYIIFSRKDHTFKMYQKFDSMYARCITGEFTIEEDAYWGSLISGTYDYGMGNWNNTYIISDLLESGSMIWTVKGDDADVSKYERCDKLPLEILFEIRE